MSGRRKNAGAGYGYMFHGSFSKKADAVAKEKKTKGAWIKSTLTNQGYRHIVMSPRTNPAKRKKRGTKAEVLKQRLSAEQQHLKNQELASRARGNPAELLVLGANPHENIQEIVLQSGSRLVIRNNPADARSNSLATFLGFAPSKPSKRELAASRRTFKQNVRAKTAEERAEMKRLRKSARESARQSRTARVFHEVYGEQRYGADGLPINPVEICGAMIGGYRCSRKPGHKGPHLPQGATMRTRTRLPHHWQPRAKNPSAEALREKFTGARVGRVRILDEPHMPAGDYAQLGKLLSLYVKPRKGGQVQEIRATGVTVVSDETARQIYFVGGDQDVSAGLGVFGAIERGAGLYELGEARRIDYKQRKEHVPHPESDSWRHEFGEETGVRPVVLYDRNAGRLLLEGGEYEIREEGIVN